MQKHAEFLTASTIGVKLTLLYATVSGEVFKLAAENQIP